MINIRTGIVRRSNSAIIAVLYSYNCIDEFFFDVYTFEKSYYESYRFVYVMAETLFRSDLGKFFRWLRVFGMRLEKCGHIEPS